MRGKIVLKGEEMTKEELEDYAMGSIQQEVIRQLSSMTTAELFLLSDVFRKRSTKQVYNVEDFIRFIRSFYKFLSEDNAEDLSEFVSDAVEHILDDRVQEELISKIADLAKESDDYAD